MLGFAIIALCYNVNDDESKLDVINVWTLELFVIFVLACQR